MNRRFTACNLLAALLIMTAPVWLNNFKDSAAPGAFTAINTFTGPAKPAAGNNPSGSPVAADVLGKIYQDISRREYHVSYDGTAKAWQSPNRAQNIRAYYAPGHWNLQNRVDSPGHNWKLGISTLGVYADGQRLATASAAPQVTASDNEIEFAHAGFTEQYINTPEGVRQNFIITAAPLETKLVEVKLQVSGMNVEAQGDNAIALSGNGQKLTYSGLKAWDADGKAVKAALQTENQTLSLIAYTGGARFPVTIDPIIANGTPANANALLESNQSGANLGVSVSGAGDVNGDGYSDVIVGADLYDHGQSDEGAAFVYHGSSTGIVTTVADTLESNLSGAPRFGVSVSGAGDVNGDGYSDVIVGAYKYSNGQSNEGAFYIYHGSATGTGTTAAAIVESNLTDAQLGFSVSGAGDVNGDGYSDVVVGAFGYSNGQTGEGAFYIYHGSSTGISTTAAAVVESNQGGAGLGNSISGAGDVNGDGYSDIIAGAYAYDNGQTDEGAAFIYHGSASGISTTAAAMVESNQATAYLGFSVSGAGDVNGDGYSDIIAGAPLYSNGQANEGAAFIYHGSASGVSTTAATTLEGNQAIAELGISVSGAGDVNGDGYSDVIAGAPLYDNGQNDEGGAFVYQGSATGIGSTAVASIESNLAGAQLGISVSGAGDVNGDGYSDVIAGANQYSNGQGNEGAAFVYHGSASTISTTAAATRESNQAGAYLGFSVASAGDVNGDGFGDVIVGAYRYDNGQTDEGAAFIYHGSATGIGATAATTIESNQAFAEFGTSVSGAGDVNGDGYGDVVAGAPLYSNGQTSEGAIFVFHGSASGISTTPAITIESNQAGGSLGQSVSGAGDVNGDGYSDVFAGAYGYDNGQTDEGAAFIYRGSAIGITTTASAMVESNQGGAGLGYSVSGAGDVNGDGYNDVVAGAYLYSNGQTSEGAFYIYHGSSTGISTTPAITIESNQATAYLGQSVSGAGDVNGDGYSDVIVGAYGYDNGETDEGAAFIYQGSSSGISTTAAAMVESNQASAFLGFSVSSAGDVNGDSYSDVIVGAYTYDNGQTDEGAALVYQGSSSGISTTAAAMVESNQASAFLGYSVSGAGDVNGDGYSDVIVGAYAYDNGQTDEGAAFVYQGNAGGGLRRALRLFNTSTTTPIQQSNINVNSFAIGLFARNPDGRSRAKLVWETKAQAQSFSSPITNSTAFTAQHASLTNVGTTGTQITSNVTKAGFQTKIRVRIKYDLVTSQNGEVYSPWIYPQGYFAAQGMNATPLPVTLLNFTAIPVEKARVQLDWQTTSQTNNDYFTVERSKDAQNWETVTVVKGAGNSSALLSYQAFDDQPYGGVSYYRLKQTDYDGKATYSAIKTVNLTGAETQLQVYPNPARSTIMVTAAEAELTRLQFFNSAGQDVTGLIPLKKISNRQIEADISRLASGVYYLKTATATGKLHKQ